MTAAFADRCVPSSRAQSRRATVPPLAPRRSACWRRLVTRAWPKQPYSPSAGSDRSAPNKLCLNLVTGARRWAAGDQAGTRGRPLATSKPYL